MDCNLCNVILWTYCDASDVLLRQLIVDFFGFLNYLLVKLVRWWKFLPVCLHLIFLWQVILKKDDRITLYCKGADSTVYPRLNPKCAELQMITTSHLNVSLQFLSCLYFRCEMVESLKRHTVWFFCLFYKFVKSSFEHFWNLLWLSRDCSEGEWNICCWLICQEFAQSGLRTLCCAVKDIDPAFFAEWQKRYAAARFVKFLACFRFECSCSISVCPSGTSMKSATLILA